MFLNIFARYRGAHNTVLERTKWSVAGGEGIARLEFERSADWVNWEMHPTAVRLLLNAAHVKRYASKET